MKLPERFLNLFQNENKDEVDDRTLTRSIVISVIGISLCMTCLLGLTWAWFSDSVVVGSNTITAATFDLDVTVTEQGAENAVTADESGYFTLDADKTYTVTLSKHGKAKTGFCLMSVKVGDDSICTPYFTESIPHFDNTTGAATEPYVFFLSTCSGAEIHIKFTAMWGQYPDDQSEKTVNYYGTLSLGPVGTEP